MLPALCVSSASSRTHRADNGRLRAQGHAAPECWSLLLVHRRPDCRYELLLAGPDSAGVSWGGLRPLAAVDLAHDYRGAADPRGVDLWSTAILPLCRG